MAEAEGMRSFPVLAAVLALAVFAAPFSGVALAQGAVPSSRLFLTLHATSVGGQFRFVFEGEAVDGNPLVVGRTPLVVNITLINDDPIAGTRHTFTILSAAGDPIVDVELDHGVETTTEFILWEEVIVQVGSNANQTADDQGGLLRFFCRPHETLGMTGRVAVGGLPPEEAEKGVFLRAYWIGLLGFAGTFLLIGISYFVIKGSSRHYRDHHEHIRRGGP